MIENKTQHFFGQHFISYETLLISILISPTIKITNSYTTKKFQLWETVLDQFGCCIKSLAAGLL